MRYGKNCRHGRVRSAYGWINQPFVAATALGGKPRGLRMFRKVRMKSGLAPFNITTSKVRIDGQSKTSEATNTLTVKTTVWDQIFWGPPSICR